MQRVQQSEITLDYKRQKCGKENQVTYRIAVKHASVYTRLASIMQGFGLKSPVSVLCKPESVLKMFRLDVPTILSHLVSCIVVLFKVFYFILFYL